MLRFSSGPNEYDAQGEAGARTLERQSQERHQAYEEELQRSHLRLTQAHEAFEEARRQRQEAAALALAQRKTEIERKLALSIPNLISIDPSKADAEDRYIDWANKHPEAFDPELAPKSVIAQYESVGKRIDAYKKRADAAAEFEEKRQARMDAKAELDREHAEKKAAIDAIVGKGGGQAKQAVIDGVTYEMPGPKQDALKEKKLEKAQKDFETGFERYKSATQTLAEAAGDPSNAGKIPISLLQSQNANRILMHTAAAKLKAANPEQAPEIDATIKDASLGEHALLQTQLNDLGNPTDAKGVERKKQLVGDLNTLKKTLGFDTMRVDDQGVPVFDSNGKVITDKATPIAETKPVTSVQDVTPSDTVKSPDGEPLSAHGASPANPNIAGDGDKVDPDTPTDANNELGKELDSNITPPAAPPVAEAQDATPPVQPVATVETAPETQPDITQDDHAKLKPGDKFWWKGKQLTKQ